MPNSKIEIYRLGEGDGIKALRVGAVRYLPRGIRKEDYARLGYFDVWLPQLAPSRGLITEYKAAVDTGKAWQSFKTAYSKEVKASTETKQLIKFISTVAAAMPVALGCYCDNETHCHRSILKALVEGA